MAELQKLHHTVRKWKPWEKDELYKHMKSELKRLEDLRLEGVKGYIEIDAYPG
jgi:hypothetical protein